MLTFTRSAHWFPHLYFFRQFLKCLCKCDDTPLCLYEVLRKRDTSINDHFCAQRLTGLDPFLTAILAVEKKIKEAFLACRSVSYTWIEGPRRFFIFKEQTPPLSLWITIPDESNSFYCHYSRCSHIYPQRPNQSFQTPNKYSRKNTRFYNSISRPWQEKTELPLQVGFSQLTCKA